MNTQQRIDFQADALYIYGVANSERSMMIPEKIGVREPNWDLTGV